jgi:hypothetical protein
VNLQIVRGDATPEEIAVLVAVLTARARRAAAARDRADAAAAAADGSVPGRPGRPGRRARAARIGGWADRSRGLRAPLDHGPGAWRASGRPG